MGPPEPAPQQPPALVQYIANATPEQYWSPPPLQDITFPCLHQGTCHKRTGKQGNPETSDIYIVPLKDFKPGDPLPMSDAKLNMEDFSDANLESSFYSICGTHLCSETQQWPVLLAFPTTTSLAEIQVHVLANDVVWKIPVVRDQPWDRTM